MTIAMDANTHARRRRRGAQAIGALAIASMKIRQDGEQQHLQDVTAREWRDAV